MTSDTEKLGGRLALLDPVALSAAQKEIYDRVDDSLGALANRIHVQSKTDDGRPIGPFNPMIVSPAISSGFLDLLDAEGKYTSLGERIRQLVILAVGAVWKSDYELYFHSAAARTAGIPENAIRTLAAPACAAMMMQARFTWRSVRTSRGWPARWPRQTAGGAGPGRPWGRTGGSRRRVQWGRTGCGIRRPGRARRGRARCWRCRR